MLPADEMRCHGTNDANPLPTRLVKRKLLQFDKSNRPAYYGTWRKKSAVVGPTCPLKMDPDLEYHYLRILVRAFLTVRRTMMMLWRNNPRLHTKRVKIASLCLMITSRIMSNGIRKASCEEGSALTTRSGSWQNNERCGCKD